eukprot:SM008466S23183  [mRNA]  locus=s8466:8:647:+ [translate_table: standard]
MNHVSLNCASVGESVDFYTKVLGFVEVRRPGSFDFDGAWLFNCGIGIHLLKREDDSKAAALPLAASHDGGGDCCAIDPRDDHISFQCEDMGCAEAALAQHGMQYERRLVREGSVAVDQIFFHDPDGHMIELCNCDNLPVVPLRPLGDLAATAGLKAD